METQYLATRISIKIRTLLDEGININYLEPSEDRKDAIKIDKIMICSEAVFDANNNKSWERFIYIDFDRYPILSGKDAEWIYQNILERCGTLIDSYLDSK